MRYEQIVTLLTSIDVDYGRIGIEARPLSQWLVNGMAEAGLPVICVEERKASVARQNGHAMPTFDNAVRLPSFG